MNRKPPRTPGLKTEREHRRLGISGDPRSSTPLPPRRESLLGGSHWGWSFKPSVGATDGIITCWDESLFTLEAEWIGTASVVNVLCNRTDGFRWLLINVYGPCGHADKLPFLNELKYFVNWWHLPSMVLGDFNLVRSPSQVVGNQRSRTEMSWFNDWIEELMLVDLPLRGANFTWSNLQARPSLSKIDHVLVSVEWEEHYPGCILKGLPRCCSDHRPIVVECLDVPRIKRPWRFENMWLLHQDFNSFLTEFWNFYSGQGICLSTLAKKLKILKAELKRWNIETFKWLDTEITLGLGMVKELDRKEEEGPFLEEDRIQRMGIKCRLDWFWKLKEVSWKQKSKETWLRLGDRNSKYFHQVADFKRRRNHLDGLIADAVVSLETSVADMCFLDSRRRWLIPLSTILRGGTLKEWNQLMSRLDELPEDLITAGPAIPF
ncbi:hypothetical protein LINPERPRIM_LOCUS25527 [Linum perenne]